MKKILFILTIGASILCSCSKFDDSALKNDIASLQKRVSDLEEQCTQMQTNLTSIQTLLTSVDGQDYITGVSPIVQDGKTIGYEIQFKKAAAIKIYNGLDAPAISVKKDSDGNFYWTLNGEFILADGKKIRANGIDGTDGKDATTPRLMIENGVWKVSYDNGKSWSEVPATGSMNIIDSIIEEDTNIIITFADGQKIAIPREVHYINGNDISRQYLPGDKIIYNHTINISSQDDYVLQVFSSDENIKVSTSCYGTGSYIDGKYSGTRDIHFDLIVPEENAPKMFNLFFELYKKDISETDYALIQSGTLTFVQVGISGNNQDEFVSGIQVCFAGKNESTRRFKFDAYSDIILKSDADWIKQTSEDDETKSMLSSHTSAIHLDENNNDLPRYAWVYVYGANASYWAKPLDKYLVVQLGAQDNISFADNQVKQICVNNFDENKDGEVSFLEAFRAYPQNYKLFENTPIVNFPEFKYFHHMQTASFSGCNLLEGIQTSPYFFQKACERQFAGCSSLSRIELPEIVNTYETECFRESGIESIELADDAALGSYAFANCTKLKSISFRRDKSNKRIYLPEGVFYECENLKDIEIGKFYHVGFKAFMNSGIGSFCLYGSADDYSFYGTKAEYVLLYSVENLGSHCFENCDLCSKVIIFGTQKTPPTIHNMTFGEAQSKTLVIYDANVKYQYIDAGWDKIFKELHIPDDGEEIVVPFDTHVDPWEE